MKLSLFGKKLNEQPGGVDNIYGNKGKSFGDQAEADYFGDAGGKLHHSRYYHDYFRGYTEIRTENPGSRFKPYKIQRVYTSPWIVADHETPFYFVYCFCYLLLALLCAVLFVSALTDRSVAANYSWIVAIPGYMGVLSLLLFVVCTVAYLLRPRRMTLYAYDSSTRRIKLFSLSTAVLCAATALTSLVYGIVAGSGNTVNALLAVAKLIGAAAAALGVWLFERKMPYKEEENTVTLPEGEAHRIQ